MKNRNGFVSNSSSSSFVCDICNEDVIGYDLSISDAEMFQCRCGHTICLSHIDFTIQEKITKEIFLSQLNAEYRKNEIDSVSAMTDEEFKEYLESENGSVYDIVHNVVPEEICPVCQMELMTMEMAVKYIIKKTGFTKAKLYKILKENKKHCKNVYDGDYLDYVQKNMNIDVKDIYKEVKNRFANYDEMFEFIYG